tara:strand:- start:1553 stop:1918 length:366 start_codon:yes stop_codon:yes gene_type:complete
MSWNYNNFLSDSKLSGPSSNRTHWIDSRSQVAADFVWRCTEILDATGSSSKPAGTQTIPLSLRLLGTGLPHTEQKSFRKPLCLLKIRMSFSPDNQRKALACTKVAALAAAPVALRHNEQWH